MPEDEPRDSLADSLPDQESDARAEHADNERLASEQEIDLHETRAQDLVQRNLGAPPLCFANEQARNARCRGE